MPHNYERVPDLGEGLRLHLNENTGGCSPRVLEALRAVTAQQVALYPAYDALVRQTADCLGVDAGSIQLTNGLDEGILAVAIASLRDRATDGHAPGSHPSPLEGIIVEPAFDMYAAYIDIAGARVVAVPPARDFEFPLAEVLGAITAATRILFLTNPNNPTGRVIPKAAIEAILRAAGTQAIVFLDEAYYEFAGETLVDEIDRHPNLVIGRTFAKAYGLAGLRAGCLIAQPQTLASICRVVPPYSLNLFAVAGLRAALGDPEYLRAYVAQVNESKRLLYDACAQLRLRCWPSAANFVLVEVGERAGPLVDALAGRRIFVRDRSGQPGCAGCVRITTGMVEHTRACIEAMKEFLCAGLS